MRRITAILTSLFLLITTVCPVFAGVTESATLTLPSDAELGGNLATWSTYLFLSGEDGISVVDVKANKTEAKWTFNSGEIPGVEIFKPTQTVVTNDYIIISNDLTIAVFKNEKTFSNTLPEFIAKITNDGESFGAIRKMFVEKDNLYIFSRAKSGEAFVFVMGLDEFEAPASDVLDITEIGFSRSLGKCDYMWSKIKTDGENAYAVFYNDETTAPYKTLSVAKIDLDDLAVKKAEAFGNSVTGLLAEVKGLTSSDASVLLSAKVSMVSNDAVEVELSSLVEVGYAEISYKESGAEVKLTEESLSGIASIFGCTTGDIKNNDVTFKLSGTGIETYFAYNENDDVYENGSIALDGGYVFVHTNSVSTSNRLLIFDDELNKINERPAIKANGSTGANDMVVIDDLLVALYKTANGMAVVYDISNPANIPYNSGENVLINGTIKAGDHNEIVKWGNGYYYISTGTNGVAVIKTDGSSRTAEMNYTEGSFPIKLYGFGVDGEAVDITIDRNNTVSAAVENGLWSYDIYYLLQGEHSFKVSNNGVTKTFEVDVTAPSLVDVSVEPKGEYLFDVTLTNNTNKYGNKFATKNFNVVFNVYSSDGSLIWADKCSFSNLGYGKTRKEAEFFLFADFTQGDRVEAVVTDASGNPLSGKISITDTTNGTYLKLPDIYGEIRDMTLEVSKIDYENRKLTLSGQANSDCKRVVALTIGGSGVTSESTKVFETDKDGEFTFEYTYGVDYIYSELQYEFSARVIGGTTAKTTTYTVMKKSDFDNALIYIKEEIADGDALITYLETNGQLAMTLGVDFNNENYEALSDGDKTEVMNEVLTSIKNGSKNVSTLFETKSKSYRKAAREAAALSALKASATTKATLTGVLAEYDDVFEISDTLWAKYSTNKKVQDINEYFIKNYKDKITSVSNVAAKLQASYDNVINPGGGSEGGLGSNTKVDPSGTIGGKYDISTDIANGNATNGYNKYFDDLANVTWAQTAINALADRGIVNGTGGKMFEPNASVTREAFVKMLIEALGLYDETATTTFIDVPNNHWAYKYIASAQKCGLTNGLADGSFGLGQLISREEMATMAYRAMLISGKKLTAGSLGFADSALIAEYAKEAVGAMNNAGIIKGTGDNKFAPKEICSRAMAAKVVYEIIY